MNLFSLIQDIFIEFHTLCIKTSKRQRCVDGGFNAFMHSCSIFFMIKVLDMNFELAFINLSQLFRIMNDFGKKYGFLKSSDFH